MATPLGISQDNLSPAYEVVAEMKSSWPDRLHLGQARLLGPATQLGTEKLKVVRGDRLDYQRTLVDLILSVLASRGEPSPLTMAIVVEDGVTESRPCPKSSRISLHRDYFGLVPTESSSDWPQPPIGGQEPFCAASVTVTTLVCYRTNSPRSNTSEEVKSTAYLITRTFGHRATETGYGIRKLHPVQARTPNLISLLKGEWHRTFEGKYDNLLGLLKIKVQLEALLALTQYYDPPLRCFTFRDFQLAPTLEGYERILGMPLAGSSPYLFKGQYPSWATIAKLLRTSKSEIKKEKKSWNV
ncbi:hypothetical protein CR513_12352, partial [Mucuna pruriens]